MFGYEGGEPRALLAAMLTERSSARARWPFLTSLDLSMIRNETQLANVVKDRTGKSRPEAENEVHSWFVGYEKRLLTAASGDTSVARRADAVAGAPLRSNAVAQ
jgi:hypothetical protein